MSARRRNPLEPRKQPRQARARETNEVLLEAAERVLAREGAEGFNTNRVAEVAGVSIGTLYQYYPSKEALLVQLQERERARTLAAIDATLSDTTRSPGERIDDAVALFFETEASERTLRAALERVAGELARSAAQQVLEERVGARIERFLVEALGADGRDLAFDAAVVQTVVSRVAEHVTGRDPAPDERRRWAAACSSLVRGYLGLRPEPSGSTS
jgi:AcrR family transcriptional regulator